MHYQKPVFWAVIASVGLCVVMAVCFLTNPKADVLVEEERNDNDIQMAGTDDRENHGAEKAQPAFGELISISRAGNSPDLQPMFRDFGITIQLPGNGNWIQDREYRQPDEKHMEIYYHDAILNADCKLLAVRDGMLELPDTIFDESLEVIWEGAAVSGQKVYVRVQRSADGKQALATWEYEEYQFAIWAEVPSEVTDIGAVPKTALGIIRNLE